MLILTKGVCRNEESNEKKNTRIMIQDEEEDDLGHCGMLKVTVKGNGGKGVYKPPIVMYEFPIPILRVGLC